MQMPGEEFLEQACPVQKSPPIRGEFSPSIQPRKTSELGHHVPGTAEPSAAQLRNEDAGIDFIAQVETAARSLWGYTLLSAHTARGPEAASWQGNPALKDPGFINTRFCFLQGLLPCAFLVEEGRWLRPVTRRSMPPRDGLCPTRLQEEELSCLRRVTKIKRLLAGLSPGSWGAGQVPRRGNSCAGSWGWGYITPRRAFAQGQCSELFTHCKPQTPWGVGRPRYRRGN